VHLAYIRKLLLADPSTDHQAAFSCITDIPLPAEDFFFIVSQNNVTIKVFYSFSRFNHDY
jgi:hypothetical protein